jgi:hypothetical protein
MDLAPKAHLLAPGEISPALPLWTVPDERSRLERTTSLYDIRDLLAASAFGEAVWRPEVLEGWRVYQSLSPDPNVRLFADTRLVSIPDGNGGHCPAQRAEALMHMLIAVRLIAHYNVMPALDRFPLAMAIYIGRARLADATLWALHVAFAARETHAALWHAALTGQNADLARMISASAGSLSCYAQQFGAWGSLAERRHGADHLTLDMLDTRSPFLSETTWQAGRALRRFTQINGRMMLTKTEAETWWMAEQVRQLDPLNQAHLDQILQERTAVWVNNVAFRDANLAARFFS